MQGIAEIDRPFAAARIEAQAQFLSGLHLRQRFGGQFSLHDAGCASAFAHRRREHQIVVDLEVHQLALLRFGRNVDDYEGFAVRANHENIELGQDFGRLPRRLNLNPSVRNAS